MEQKEPVRKSGRAAAKKATEKIRKNLNDEPEEEEEKIVTEQPVRCRCLAGKESDCAKEKPRKFQCL